MIHKEYSDYQDIKKGWLYKIPDHWISLKGRRIFEQSRIPLFPGDEQLTASQKYGVIPQTLFMELEGIKVVLALKGIDGFKHVEKDEFVISLRSFQGGIEHCKYSGCVSPAYTVLKPAKEIHPEYFSYLLKSTDYIGALQAVTDGIREGKNISYEQFGSIDLPIPPIAEQIKIASFLKQELEAIDSLINKQESLINLLNEKLKVQINEVVIKGVRSSKRKEFNQGWIMGAPDHWSFNRVGNYFTERREKVSDTIYAPLSVTKNGIVPQLDTAAKSDDGENRKLVRKGDFVINSRSDRKGSSGLSELDGSVSLINTVITPSPSLNGRYVHYLFRSNLFQEEYYRYGKGIVADLWSTNYSEFKNIVFPIPPIHEQAEIVLFLDDMTDKIQDLVCKSKQSIGFLKEHRASLISAAVTGKIDVRDLA